MLEKQEPKGLILGCSVLPPALQIGLEVPRSTNFKHRVYGQSGLAGGGLISQKGLVTQQLVFISLFF